MAFFWVKKERLRDHRIIKTMMKLPTLTEAVEYKIQYSADERDKHVAYIIFEYDDDNLLVKIHR